jgi:hypothetical protein
MIGSSQTEGRRAETSSAWITLRCSKLSSIAIHHVYPMLLLSQAWRSCVLLLAICGAVSCSQGPLASEDKAQPNIVFILTDDQDLHMDSLEYMPLLKKHLVDEGLLFERHYCTVALCCPSRVSLWTGKAAHNTNVTDVNPPYGGSSHLGKVVYQAYRI